MCDYPFQIRLGRFSKWTYSQALWVVLMHSFIGVDLLSFLVHDQGINQTTRMSFLGCNFFFIQIIFYNVTGAVVGHLKNIEELSYDVLMIGFLAKNKCA